MQIRFAMIEGYLCYGHARSFPFLGSRLELVDPFEVCSWDISVVA